MSFWNLSDNTDLSQEKNTSADLGGGAFKPIPEGTKVPAIITEAEWKEYDGQRYINLRWDIIDGDYKDRVIFQKVRVYEPDTKKADKHKRMFRAIDANCGGHLSQKNGEPTDVDMMGCLVNKPMFLRLGEWEMNGKSGNWVQQVQSYDEGYAELQNNPNPEEPGDDHDDDIPF